MVDEELKRTEDEDTLKVAERFSSFKVMMQLLYYYIPNQYRKWGQGIIKVPILSKSRRTTSTSLTAD